MAQYHYYCKFRIFAKILFLRIAFKDILGGLKIFSLGHDLHTSVNDRVFAILRGFSFHETSHICEVYENKTLTKISEFTVIRIHHEKQSGSLLQVSVAADLELHCFQKME